MFWKNSLALFTLVALFSSSVTAEVIDVKAYKRIAVEVIQESMKGEEADANEMIRKNNQLIDMGVQSIRSYHSSNPEYTKLLTMTVDSVSAMRAMSLEEIEEQWHELGFLEKHGINARSIEHFGEVISLMDCIVHPVTANIAIRAYQQSRDHEYLEQVKAELSEVLEHLKHIH